MEKYQAKQKQKTNYKQVNQIIATKSDPNRNNTKQKKATGYTYN